MTHRAGGMQAAPDCGSHGWPSAAFATHVPGVDPCAPKQVDALVQSITMGCTKPHWPPADVYDTAAQVWVAPLPLQ